MADRVDEIPADEALGEVSPRSRRWPKVLAGIGALLLGFFVTLWVTRDEIANNIIASQLKKNGLSATYKIESIGPRKQELSNLVIGDPAHPDLTVERVQVAIVPRFGFPVIGQVRLVKARLYGRYAGGKLSFGSLDKLLAPKQPAEPFRLPDLDLRLDDARALIVGEAGDIGIKLQGAGNLRGGFAGYAAAVAPKLALAGCRAERASFYGQVTVAGEQPTFDGPLRLARLDCPTQDVALRNANLGVRATFDKALDGGDARLALESGAFRQGQTVLVSSKGTAQASYRKAALTAKYDLTGTGFSHPQFGAVELNLAGMLRAQDSFARLEIEGQVRGRGLHPGKGLDVALASAQASGKDTPAEALIAKLRGALGRHGPNSSLAGSYVLRQTGGITNLVIPDASVTGGSGARLLAVSRLQLVAGGASAPKLSGNFRTGGDGMPQISGRLERRAAGTTLINLVMADYAAGGSHLALPEMQVAQGSDGTLGFVGRARLSGPLLGGAARDVEVPLDGRIEPSGRFELWRGCRDIRFAQLSYANLTLDKRSLTLCPGSGGAIVRSGPKGMTFAATTRSLDLTGQLGTTPIHLVSGAVALSNPGKLDARAVQVALGPPDKPAKFVIDHIDARMGKEIAGTFSGTEARLFAVPLDITAASGNWRYSGGKLALSEGAFTLTDRPRPDPADPGKLAHARFEPLLAQGATLELADSRITAQAVMKNPKSGREIVAANMVHDLNSAVGHADLTIAGIKFDRQLQPSEVSYLAQGVVSGATGVVTGTGRIDWNPREVTSTGTFSTQQFDFAALFGAVKGLSGTVHFTDLLGMVTAPDQRLKIGSINPGIEALDGELSFEMKPDSVLQVNGATWPFLDGRMTLLPTTMKLGEVEERRYELKMDGISAARFIEQMELANISATGKFSGTLPLVFDENGGRIEGGLLVALPPGGNVSYVGELTYKDMGAMANFAFGALRSLDYRQMRIAMDGALEGELVTRVRFDGVTQGEGANRNIITRQLAHLPIQFNINLRAPFYKVITGFKQFNDPALLPDPHALGLIDAQGRPIVQPPVPALPQPSDSQPPIQPSESEKRP